MNLGYMIATNQPPSGGCVLKHHNTVGEAMLDFQPPSGGCVLKQEIPCKHLYLTTTSRLRAAVC